MTGKPSVDQHRRTPGGFVGESPDVAHLCKVDPVLRRVIRRVGPYVLKPKIRRPPFESLVRAIAYQQLHDRAAECILGRFTALFPGCRFPTPEAVLTVPAHALRGVGFSEAKVLALRDLAAKTLDGTVPSGRAIRALTDDAIIERLVAVRGIGRWTVEMVLIFQLGRPDVLPVDDFGVRNGFRIAYGRQALPKPKEVLEYGERWRPYRTTAAWYLWRAVDLEKPGARMAKGTP